MHKNFSLHLPQVCADCAGVTYPPQGFCHKCLSEGCTPMALPMEGVIFAKSVLHYSLEEQIKPYLPVKFASVKIEGGAVIFAIEGDDGLELGQIVLITEQDHEFGTLLTAVKEKI